MRHCAKGLAFLLVGTVVHLVAFGLLNLVTFASPIASHGFSPMWEAPEVDGYYAEEPIEDEEGEVGG